MKASNTTVFKYNPELLDGWRVLPFDGDENEVVMGQNNSSVTFQFVGEFVFTPYSSV